MMRVPLVATFISVGWCLARADTYVQPADPAGIAVASTEFTDTQEYSSYCMDDIKIMGGGWNITAISVWGEVASITGTINTPLNIRFSSDHSWTNPGTIAASHTTPIMTVANGITTVSGLSIGLAPGHYWMSFWVTAVEGAQWFWKPTFSSPPYDDPAYVQNPGGGYGLGTDPFPVQSVSNRRDFAFSITYNPVPETPSVLVIAAGALFVGLARRMIR